MNIPIPINIKLSSEAKSNPVKSPPVKLLPVQLSSFFASSKATSSPVIYRIFGPELETHVTKAISQLFVQTTRRLERTAVQDDEFFHAEKSRRVEQARRVFRSNTRFNNSIPERKKPLSSLLCPPVTANPDLLKKIGWKIIESMDELTDADIAREKPDFPGSIPMSLMRDDIETMLYNPQYFWVLAPKTNGLRFFLVAATFNNERLFLLIDRSQTIYLVPMAIPEIFFDGSVFDGELVRLSNGEFSFLIFDCMQTNGVPCSEHNYLIRMYLAGMMCETFANLLSPNETETKQQSDADDIDKLVEKLFDSDLTAQKKSMDELIKHEVNDSNMQFSIRCKQLYSFDQILSLLHGGIQSLDHSIDGLILTAVESCVQLGRTNMIFKFKRGSDNTIDLAFHALMNGKCLLMCTKGEQATWVTWTEIDSFKFESAQELISRLGLALESVNEKESTDETLKSKIIQELEGRVVEARYMKTGDWSIESIRYDKTLPNKLSTAEKTWINIKENLTLLDMFVPGSVSDATREAIANWEKSRANKHWQDLPFPKQTIYQGSVAGMGPVTIKHLSRFS